MTEEKLEAPFQIKAKGQLFTCRKCGSNLYGKTAFHKHDCNEELAKRGLQFANAKGRSLKPLEKKAKTENKTDPKVTEFIEISKAIKGQIKKAGNKSELKAISDRFDIAIKDLKTLKLKIPNIYKEVINEIDKKEKSFKK